ncbi:MAG: aminotransferase class I/II-fold pyridoxal phosphate-dependent enzyme [Candidatus Neptunochlamydia sp.]|nr:aminotransferase class I/II-fold pyridoxal phosphate-dependent enzyme [Candidatus Neptunochlamydia sp.]
MKQLLSKRKKVGNFRSLQFKENLIDFSSNDYLGLARSQHLKQAVLYEWESIDYLGSTGSRLLTGNSMYIEGLEARIARFHGFETGLIFNCGYMANIGLISTMAEEEDTILFDSHIHASMYEGIRLSRAKAFPFRHNDLDHLENRLKKATQKGNTYICVESLYSTDGSITPLNGIFSLSLKYPSHLIVDEAHAVGIFGNQGRGLVYEAGLSGKIFAQIITFGKALGVFGAIILGNEHVKESLVNFAKSFIYTTALPFPSLAAIKCSYELFPKLETERIYLRNLTQLVNRSQTPIQPIPVAHNQAAHRVVSSLKQRGFDIRAFLSPTVQKGKEIIRLTLHAFNSKEELMHLLELLRKYG